MNYLLNSRYLRRSFQALLSVSLAVWVLAMGSFAYASPMKQQKSSSKCPTIPANFDFAHASKQELHRYLLPARPPASDKQAVSDWQKAVTEDIQGKGVCVPDQKTSTLRDNGRAIYFGAKSASCPSPTQCCPTMAPSGTQCTETWNGYYVGNDTQPGFNEVVGQWNVECVSVSQSPSGSAVASWIGLGGVWSNDGDLWQIGSAWDPTNGYTLWYEEYPDFSPVTIAHTSCGDHISADIWFAPNSPSTGLGYHLTDNSTSYRGTGSNFTSGELSAEWIDERPSCATNTYFGLADYNYSEWTRAYASPNNPTAGFDSIGQLPHTRLWMQDTTANPTRIAWTDTLGSELGSGTDNYRAYWQSNGSIQC